MAERGKLVSFVLDIRNGGKVRLSWVSASKPSLALDHLQGYIEEHYITMVAPSSKISN